MTSKSGKPFTRRVFFRQSLGSLALCAFVGMSGMVQAATPDDMLVVAHRIDDITTLDPAQSFEFSGSDVNYNVYGKLVNFDPLDLAAGYQPDLAESWVVSEDGKSIVFTMREGVTFHSGNPVTAEDAAFSLQRVIKLNKTPAFILTQFGFTPENVEETIVADGNTLTITTDEKYAISFVLNCLTATVGGIVEKALVMEHEKDGDLGNDWLATNSAGSGAYKVVNWKPSESYTLAANPDFYRGAPAMKRVIVQHIQESATQRLLLEKGDVDVARNLNPEDVAGLEGMENLTVDTDLRGNLMYISFNQKNEQLANPKVLEALKYLVDYEGMENSFLKGQWKVHQSFLPATYLGAIDDKPFSFNLEKARALLAESGVENLEFEAGVREAQERIEIAQSLQNTFAQAGITMNISMGTGKQILTRYRARELDMYLGEWGPDYPDPQTNAGTFAYNPDNSDEAQATGLLAYRNAWDPGPFSETVQAAVFEGDSDKRRAMYEQLQRDFQATAPFVIMFQKTEQFGRQASVKDFTIGGPVTSAAYWPVSK